jgi:hypothetical protein
MHLLLFKGSETSIYDEIFLDAYRLTTAITNAPIIAITDRTLFMEYINSY